MQSLKAHGWEINPTPPPPLGCDSPSVGSISDMLPKAGLLVQNHTVTPLYHRLLHRLLAFYCIRLKAEMLLVSFFYEFVFSFSTSAKL